MSLEVLIRNCDVQDVPRVLEIEKVSFDDPYPESLFLSFLERFANGFRIAEYRGALVGYSVLLPLHDRNTAVITSLAVHPDFKRNKIATNLLTDAIIIARKIEAPSVTLQVAVNNIAAQTLYSKFGFTKTRIIRDYYRKGLDGIEMVLSLKAD